jgi:hypothetical protein
MDDSDSDYYAIYNLESIAKLSSREQTDDNTKGYSKGLSKQKNESNYNLSASRRGISDDFMEEF